jgi:hypothetical protein
VGSLWFDDGVLTGISFVAPHVVGIILIVVLIK